MAVAVAGTTATKEGTSSWEDQEDVKYKKKYNKKVNWGHGSHKEQMDKEVIDWLESKGYIIDRDDKLIDSLKLFCGVVNIPYNIFQEICW